MLKRLLFPVKPDGTATSAMLLIARIVFGILLMNHGIQKWTNFQELSAVFPDPLGVGSPLSLGLAIFGDRKSTRLNSSHDRQPRMPSSA